MEIPHELHLLCLRIQLSGGRPLLVGGAVRDALAGKDITDVKDWDIEVFGLKHNELNDAVKSMGRIDEVGKSFGVTKLTTGSGEDYDISIPRREIKNGSGHKGFEIISDPDMQLEEALLRRDFTINAMCYDPIQGDYVDLMGGFNDLEDGILRPVSERFKEDPLRVLRGVQFAGRFDMEASPEFIRMAKEVKSSFCDLPGERVYGVMEKWATKSVVPSKGLKILQETGWIEHFPEIERLAGTPQPANWHPEGDVLIHTGHCCDSLAVNPVFRGKPANDRANLMFAMLAHDFGKPETTRLVEQEDGTTKITAHGHEAAGVAPFKSFLKRIKAPRRVFEKGAPIVKEHLVHSHFQEGLPSDKAVLRLSKRLGDTSIEDLALVMQADLDGRPPLPKGRGPGIKNLLVASRNLGVNREAPKPFVLGRDLIDLGLEAGEHFGGILKGIEERQLDGEFADREQALEICKAELLAPRCAPVSPEMEM